MYGPPRAKASGIACVTLGYLWNAPSCERDAAPSQTDHDATGTGTEPQPARPHMRATGTAVCASGRSRGEWGQDVSACAHGAPTRVQSRTRNRQNGTALVRLCTRCLLACAKSDTRLAVSHRSCPLVHTGRPRVCKVGHETGRMAPLLSVCTHHRMPRVHKRTRRRARGLALPACARGKRSTGPRDRPK